MRVKNRTRARDGGRERRREEEGERERGERERERKPESHRKQHVPQKTIFKHEELLSLDTSGMPPPTFDAFSLHSNVS
jgi:hypothetical protein